MGARFWLETSSSGSGSGLGVEAAGLGMGCADFTTGAELLTESGGAVSTPPWGTASVLMVAVYLGRTRVLGVGLARGRGREWDLAKKGFWGRAWGRAFARGRGVGMERECMEGMEGVVRKVGVWVGGKEAKFEGVAFAERIFSRAERTSEVSTWDSGRGVTVSG